MLVEVEGTLAETESLKMKKLTVVLDYVKAIETYSRIELGKFTTETRGFHLNSLNRICMAKGYSDEIFYLALKSSDQ